MKLTYFEKSTETVVKMVSFITGPIPDHTASHWLPSTGTVIMHQIGKKACHKKFHYQTMRLTEGNLNFTSHAAFAGAKILK
jgi:hypothetical protein